MIRQLCLSALVLAGAVSPALAEAPLRWKYTPGGKSAIETEVKTHQILTLAGMDLETKVKVFTVVRSTAGKRQKDGTLRVTQKTETLQADLDLPGGIALSFSSTDPDKKADIEELEQVLQYFRVLYKTPTVWVVDRDNRLEKIEVDAKASEGLSEQFKGLFTSESLKKVADQELDVLPDGEVKKGATWERTAEAPLPGGQTLTFRTRYTYEGTVGKGKEARDKISFVSTEVTLTAGDGGDSPLKVVESDLKIKESKGHFLFDRARGQIVEQKEKVRIAGKATFEAGGMKLDGSIDLTIENNKKLRP